MTQEDVDEAIARRKSHFTAEIHPYDNKTYLGEISISTSKNGFKSNSVCYLPDEWRQIIALVQSELRNFEVGDKVLCVDGFDDFPKTGETYTVSGFKKSPGGLAGSVTLEEVKKPHAFSVFRFELA